MPAPLPLPDSISQGSSRTRKNRTVSTQFGDGYKQSRPDGVNNKVDSWSLTYEGLNGTERASLWAVLDAVGGWDYLTWAPPGGTSKKWKVTQEGISEVPASGELYTVSFSLEQFF